MGIPQQQVEVKSDEPVLQLKSIVGEWQCEKNENFDELLKSLQIGWLKRKAIVAANAAGGKQTLTISVNGNEVNEVNVGLKTINSTFELDKDEQKMTTIAGDCPVTASWNEEESELILDTFMQGKKVLIKRKVFLEDSKRMLVTIQSQDTGVVAKKHFVRA